MRWRTRGFVVASVFALAALVLAGAGLLTGSSAFGPAEVIAVLRGEGDAGVARIVTDIRLPRVVAGLVVGGALAVSGAMFQSLSRNALGSPDIIGFVTGAATGAIVAITVFSAPPALVAAAAVAGGSSRRSSSSRSRHATPSRPAIG